MKKLITTLFTGAILLGTSQTTIADHIKFPEKFKDYQNHLLDKKYAKINSGKYVEMRYFDIPDKNGKKDGKQDVIESRIITFTKDGIHKIAEFPLIYWFDSNKDNIDQYHEIIIDYYQDGWNGNEEGYNPGEQLPKKKSSSNKKEIFI